MKKFLQSYFRDWPFWKLLLFWGLAIGWLWLLEWCITWIPTQHWFDLGDHEHPRMMSWEHVIEPLLRALVRFILRVLQGLVLFLAILSPPYWRPVQLLVRASFLDDEPPRLREGAWTHMVRRTIEWGIFYSNMLSLPSVRRFVYVALWPLVTASKTASGSGTRFSVLNISPDRIVEKIQIYIETELFHPQQTAGPSAETKTEYGERIAGLYINNVKTYDSGRRVTLDCQSCFDIFGATHERIRRYLESLKDLNLPAEFKCSLSFRNGYLAPTYLVSGLLNEFDEDWTLIVNAYNEKLTRDIRRDPLLAAGLHDLRRLQSFIWDCWIQWGPSVPIVRSQDWIDGGLALQFGYGDENNSLAVYLEDAPDGRTAGNSNLSRWEERLSLLRQELDSHVIGAAWAWPVTLVGHVRLLSRRERNEAFCSAQRDTNTAEKGDGWLVLEAESIETHRKGPLTYSAYVWVLIAICTDRPLESGKSHPESVGGDVPPETQRLRSLFAETADEWRYLIPYFQHGNIAEESVFNDIKRELAFKTVESLLDQLRKAHRLGVDWLHFAYAAAVDDNGDDVASPLLVRPPGESISELLQTAVRERRRSLADLKNPTSADQIDLALLDRIHGESDAWPSLRASDLPRVVRTYLDHIESLRED